MRTGPNSWGVTISNIADGTQPSTTPGTTLTPGNNTYPAYAQILAATSDETFFMRIEVWGIGATAAAKDALLKLGFDFGGGTTYTDLTINDLLVSCASAAGNGSLTGPGICYEFPVRVPAGTTVAASVSTNNATVGNAYVGITLLGKPSHPENIRYGTFVRSFGATAASSRGTAVTPGGASDGAFSASLGTTTEDLWAWEFGWGRNTTTMANGQFNVDVAVSDDAGTTKRIVIQNARVFENSTEMLYKTSALSYGEAKAGATVYARAQGLGAATTNCSVMAYGVGG